MNEETSVDRAPVDAVVMLRCPFCGGEPSESQYQDESLWSHDIVTWHRVYCSTCDIGMNECGDREALVLRWNHRAT